jgi:hypothetical protein
MNYQLNTLAKAAAILSIAKTKDLYDEDFELSIIQHVDGTFVEKLLLLVEDYHQEIADMPASQINQFISLQFNELEQGTAQ